MSFSWTVQGRKKLVRNTLEDKTVWNVKYVALAPSEFSGQVAWEGSRDDVIDALENHLLGVFGPKRFKITSVEEADIINEDKIVELPIEPTQSKEEH